MTYNVLMRTLDPTHSLIVRDLLLTGTRKKKRVWAVPRRMHRLGISGEGKSAGQMANPDSDKLLFLSVISTAYRVLSGSHAARLLLN